MLRAVSGGSIPARAGEPSQATGLNAHSGVYPRACGGTLTPDCCSPRLRGLSPRVRGNRLQPPDRDVLAGSIPARAGEPSAARRGAAPGWVYPRACGGTRAQGGSAGPPRGLSPRVRGNHSRLCPGSPPVRSIPARAGEPHQTGEVQSPGKVYPRACGGTCVLVGDVAGSQGLSPRVRGNPPNRGDRAAYGGSIPARAGEPWTRAGCNEWAMVYPRACGGTKSLMPCVS